jgi:flagellar protein FlaG
MRIGDVTTETGARPQRQAVEDRTVVQLTQHSVAVEKPYKEAKPAPPIEVPKIESVTKQIDSFLRSIGRTINFRVDPGSGRTIVSVLDATTGEVIREVPGEDALKLAQNLENSLGAFVDERA